MEHCTGCSFHLLVFFAFVFLSRIFVHRFVSFSRNQTLEFLSLFQFLPFKYCTNVLYCTVLYCCNICPIQYCTVQYFIFTLPPPPHLPLSFSTHYSTVPHDYEPCPLCFQLMNFSRITVVSLLTSNNRKFCPNFYS